MDIQSFLSIGIVGVALSGVVAMIKAKYGIEGSQTKILTVILAVAVGAGYVWVSSTPFYQTFILALGSASAVYAMTR